MKTNPIPTHDDGLEWLRDIRRKLLMDAGGDILFGCTKFY